MLGIVFSYYCGNGSWFNPEHVKGSCGGVSRRIQFVEKQENETTRLAQMKKDPKESTVIK